VILARLGAQREEAVILMEWGEISAAKALIDELEPRLRATSDGNGAPIWFEHTRGMLLWRLGDFSQATQVLQGVTDRARGQNRANIAWANEFALAQIALDLGQLSAAETQLAALAPEPPNVRRAGFRLSPAGVRARLLLLRGAAADAARAVEEELARIGPPSGRSSHAALATMLLGARAQATAGDASRALQLAHGAVKLAQDIARQPSRSADAGEALLVLAQVQQQVGNTSGSAATARQALLSLANGLGAQHALTVQAGSLTSP
jgi:eukaryotic-like serine/threonine-protein kinase